MSINGMVLRLGQTFGPPIIGLGYALNAYKGTYFPAGGIAILSLVVIYLLLNGK
jgi:MFS transporter, ACDE family, multidrug resistance protein